jgi:regulator of protease activity HflC (stomatin/prohibitin superfamily)
MRRRLAVLLALTVLLTLGACGGDDGLSANEYRSQARQICRDADRATEAVEEPTRATSQAIVDYFKRLLQANERSTKRFESLDPPDELQKAHDDALRANRDGVREVRRVISELEEGGEPRKVLTGAQTRLEGLSRDAADAAKRLGVPECADE